MIYEQVESTKEASKIIKSFWLIDSKEDTIVHKEKIIPDGYPELIFHYGDPYKININGFWQLQSMNIIAGQIKNYFYLENTGQSKMFAIKFQPWALAELFQFEMSSITDKVIELPEEIYQIVKPVQEIAVSTFSFKEKAHKIEEWFVTYMAKIQLNKKQKIVTEIIAKKGLVRLKELQQKFEVNERTMERYFKSYIGVSPKFYSRIIRFSSIFQLVQEEEIDWADIVFRAGYYDQSHFIKNFKEFTGEDPSKYGFSEENMANFFLKP